MNQTDERNLLEELKSREPIFHHPNQFGKTRQDIENQICEDFWEVGASGNVYTKSQVIETLLERYQNADYQDIWDTSDFSLTEIAPDNYLLTYILVQNKTRRTRRATLWRKENDLWKVLYHQGTVINESPCHTATPGLVIRRFTKLDIELLVSSFATHDWIKPRRTFEEYLREQENGERLIWIALVQEALAGYITLRWTSRYPLFSAKKIPEIMDLNVLPPFRRMGVGSTLLKTAESAAREKVQTVGIGVGLYAGDDGGYGPAQRLYVNSGYIPDGNGLTYDYQTVLPGETVRLDDELVLWFTKTLK